MKVTTLAIALVLVIACGADESEKAACQANCPGETNTTVLTYASAVADNTGAYPAGDCDELDDYAASYSVGEPDCTDCIDYCTTAQKSKPCSWFAPTDYPEAGGAVDTTILSFATPVAGAEQLRIWVTNSATPLDELAEVAVADGPTGTFTVLSGGSHNPVCTSPRTGVDNSLSYDLSAISFSIGAVRLGVKSWNLGIDAVAVVSR